MPGEADRLKKENEELKQENAQLVKENLRYIQEEMGVLRPTGKAREKLEKQIETLEVENDALRVRESRALGVVVEKRETIRQQAERIKELEEECRKLSADNASLEGSLELANEKLAEAEERCQLEAKEVADLTRWLDAAGLERDALKEENAQLLLSNGALQVRLNHSTPHGRPNPEVEAMRELRDKAVAMEVREEMKELKKEDPLRYCDNLSARLDELAQRVDQLAAAYDTRDLMRDSLTSRLGSLERQVRELTIEVGRLRNDERRWWQR